MQKINYLFWGLIFFLSVSSVSVSAQPMRLFEKGEKRYVYALSYKEIDVGKLTVELQHQGDEIIANTKADLFFLFLRFAGNQLSHIYWDETSQLFISKQFARQNIGFKHEKTLAYFLESGHKTSVTLDGDTHEFVNKKEKIIDFNTIGIQMSEGLKSGKKHFEFYMQSSDSVKHYFFDVTGKEVIDSKFGKLETFRVEQTHKEDRTLVAWFSPEINYQIVKFHYQFNLLDLHGVLTEYSSSN